MTITIAALLEKGKYWAVYSGHLDQAVGLLVIAGVALGAFACGRLSVIEERASPVAIENVFLREKYLLTASSSSSSKNEGLGEAEEGRAGPVTLGAVVASKNSTKYHLPWCSGAKTIKEENKIWFASEADAQDAGYTKAGNCK